MVNPEGRAPLCIVCEHASAFIPDDMGSLGLAGADRLSHAAWDIGAEMLARALAAVLDAPLVVAQVSRLVVDLNRPPASPEASPAKVETIEIPGNRDLDDAARTARADAIYAPFHAKLDAVIGGFAEPPALITIHSFTPVWHGVKRKTEIGLLHDTDDRLARAMLDAAPESPSVALNEPYSAADGVLHMLQRHGTARGLPSVMVEVRNDLLPDALACAAMAATLAAMIRPALSTLEAT